MDCFKLSSLSFSPFLCSSFWNKYKSRNSHTFWSPSERYKSWFRNWIIEPISNQGTFQSSGITIREKCEWCLCPWCTHHSEPSADPHTRYVQPGLEDREGWRPAHQCLFCEVSKGNVFSFIIFFSYLNTGWVGYTYYLLFLWSARKQNKMFQEDAFKRERSQLDWPAYKNRKKWSIIISPKIGILRTQ